MLYCTSVELTLGDFRGVSTTEPFSRFYSTFPNEPNFSSWRGRNRRIITSTTHHSTHPCFVGKFSKRYVNHCGAEGDGVVRDRSEFKIRRRRLLWWDWVRKSFKRKLAMFLVCSGVVTTLLFGRFETIPYSNRTQFLIFKTVWEKKLGEWGSNYMKTESEFKDKILPDIHPATVRVRKIGDDIFRALKTRVSLDQQKGKPSRVKRRGSYLNGLNWQIIVVDDPSVNAGCFPGGYIVVFKGLLDRFKSNAELATVICHEVGHAVARHHAESITNKMWFRMLQLTFILWVDFARANVLLISELCRSILLDLPACRSMELEADYIGLLLLASAGYDPRVFPRVIENKLSNLDGSSEELPELLEYISTHPSNKKRAEILAGAHVMDEAFSIYRDVKGRRGVKGFLKNIISSFPFFGSLFFNDVMHGCFQQSF